MITLYLLVGRESSMGADARAPRATSGVTPDGPAIEEVLAAVRTPTLSASGSLHGKQHAKRDRPGFRQRRPTAAPATSSTRRAPSTGTGRNPRAPICPGSTACHRTWRLRCRTSTSSAIDAMAIRHSPAPRAGQTRGLRSERPPAAGKGGSSVSRRRFSHNPARDGKPGSITNARVLLT